jgi:quinol monooxygenase YgiN
VRRSFAVRGLVESVRSPAVVRVSKGSFDPARFAEIERMRDDVGGYLVPAIARLEGLLGYYAGTSPDGSIVDVSVWDSDEHANQMGQLKEVVDARQAAEALGVTFIPIVNYPLSWHV